MDDYRLMTQARFRIADSFFINHNEEGASEAILGGFVADLGERQEGEWHEEDALIVPLISNSGATIGYLSLDDPVDRKVPALATIRQAEFLALQATTAIESAEIYDRLAKKNSELAQATKMLKSLGEMKNNFVATVSHELRTPLTSITAYTEILREAGGNMPEEVLGEFLRVITNETEKLTTIIDDILDLSRMEGTPSRVDSRNADLVTLVKRLQENTVKHALEKDIEFKVVVPPDPVVMDADPVLLQQLLEHLLNNALKFTSAGGEILLRLDNRPDEIVLTVEDSGIGIPEEKMQYIFDRFYQVDGSSTREHGGQGVGLAICQDIVDYHDGRIWAENVEPSGARFTVTLPHRLRVLRGLERGQATPVRTNPGDLLEQLIQWIAETCGVEIVSLLTPDTSDECLTVKAAVGLPESVVQSTEVRKGAGIVGKVWSSGRALLVPDVTADVRFDKPSNDLKYSTNSLLSVPLLDGLEIIGIVNVNNRRDGQPLGQDDQLLLESLAPRISNLLKQYHGHNTHTARFTAINNALRLTVSLQRHEHNELTSLCHEICLATARRMKLPAEEIQHLVIALRCYDVGLCRISGQLLHKATPLTDEERLVIQSHVAASLEILTPLQIPSKVRQIILHHHERFDGEGYPDGLEGESIPIGARLVTLTDSLHAMLQQRPYRPALDLEKTLTEIEQQSGHQFCPRMTAPFLAEVRDRAADLEKVQQQVAQIKRWTQPRPEIKPAEPVGVSAPAQPDSSS
jgi:signal transduction histidine kinase/putative methionine-R-sulfoxide reductase with GAF domain